MAIDVAAKIEDMVREWETYRKHVGMGETIDPVPFFRTRLAEIASLSKEQ